MPWPRDALASPVADLPLLPDGTAGRARGGGMGTGTRETPADPEGEAAPADLRSRLRDLYFGGDTRATRFQLGLLAFDLVTVTFFLVATFLPVHRAGSWSPTSLIAIGLALDFAVAALHLAPAAAVSAPAHGARRPGRAGLAAAAGSRPQSRLPASAARPAAGRAPTTCCVRSRAEVPFVRRNHRVIRAAREPRRVRVPRQRRRLRAAAHDQSGHQRLSRRALFHRRHPDHHGLRRHHAARASMAACWRRW